MSLAQRVAVTGGRNFSDKRLVGRSLTMLNMHRPISWLIHGNASGADTLAASWAATRGIGLWPFEPDWDDIGAPGAVVKRRSDGKLYNALAGFWRNERMLIVARPDVLLSFPGGKGTEHCTNEARKLGIRVILATANLTV
jgi:hypothetical protein